MSFIGENGLLLENDSGVILLEQTDDIPPADFLLLEVAASGNVITNSGATQTWGNTYTMCQRSGRKYKPGVLVKEWTGLWVHPDYLDLRSEQDMVRDKSENLTGSERPESEPVFISTPVQASDL